MLSCYYGNRQGFFLFVTTLLAIGMDAIQMGAFIYFFFFISNLRAKPANWMRRRTTSSRHSIKLLREKTSRTSMEPEKKNVVLIFILFYKLFSIYYTQVETPWKPSPIKSIHLCNQLQKKVNNGILMGLFQDLGPTQGFHML